MFQGATSLSLDAKGRLTVPARHREVLQAQGGSVVLTAHPHRCLLLFPAQAWPAIRERVSGFSAFDPQAALFKRVLVGFAEEQQLDGGGRVLVSPELRRYAGLDKQVMLLGQGSHFELWNPEALDRQLESIAATDKLPPGLENFAL